ncbi:MAG: outer membrane beta-barrel protein [Nitrospiraceae bacterium]
MPTWPTNDQPSYGGQWAYKVTPRLTLTQTVYAGPDQTNTSLEFWRLYGNHIVEWKGEDLTVAFSYDIGTEKVANRPGQPRRRWQGRCQCGGPLAHQWTLGGRIPARSLLGPERPLDRQRAVREGDDVDCGTGFLRLDEHDARSSNIDGMNRRGAGGDSLTAEGQPGVIGRRRTSIWCCWGILWTFDSP